MRSWIFYGHLWIALAAALLSWQSTYLIYGSPALLPVHVFVFLATFAVYTLHRWLSYRGAPTPPDHRRYRLVAAHPRTSFCLGLGGALGAAAFLPFLGWRVFTQLLWALPLTLFYLLPFYPGGPRLREVPYLKMVFVALAWTIMTVEVPRTAVVNETFFPPYHNLTTGIYGTESISRFCLILSCALLFDLRDVQLDRSRGLRTLAVVAPAVNKGLSVILLLVCILLAPKTPLSIAYTICLLIALLTHEERGEDWYAVWVNGMLVIVGGSLVAGSG